MLPAVPETTTPLTTGAVLPTMNGGVTSNAVAPNGFTAVRRSAKNVTDVGLAFAKGSARTSQRSWCVVSALAVTWTPVTRPLAASTPAASSPGRIESAVAVTKPEIDVTGTEVDVTGAQSTRTSTTAVGGS